ncbi:MAG TPA: hypothetical protein VNN07_19350, partial [Candidatus Tectomicrobia bacterium]|nr:hypothetical protein [Candidatus Tectomicrobia bacterium]
IVVVLPGDRVIDPAPAFVRALARAADAVQRRPDLALLVAAPPRAPVADGWIEPGAPIDGLEMYAVRTVERIVDGVPPAEGRRLFDTHALASTLVIVGRVDCLLALGRRHVPDVMEALEPLQPALDTPVEPVLSDALYEAMPERDLAAVERAPELALLPVPDVAWHTSSPRRRRPAPATTVTAAAGRG